MLATTSKKATPGQKRPVPERQQSARAWFSRQLRRPPTEQGKNDDEVEMLLQKKEQDSPPRPKTAPSAGLITRSHHPHVLYPMHLEPPLARPLNRTPPRPPRPDSNVIRDVNAWLDASIIKPAPPLMAGLDYWKEGTFSTGSGPSSDVRYAVPIVKTDEDERPATSHALQIRSFCRRAKKMQVRMPAVLHTRSQRHNGTQRKQPNRRSTSMPLLSASPPQLSGSTPKILARSRSLMHLTESSSLTTTSTHSGGWIRPCRAQLVGQSPRLARSEGGRFDDQESSMERRINAVFGQRARLGDHTRPGTALARVFREESMANMSENLSDAPTYSSGPPPPSYRSRAASIRTTSSFGCIDAMNSARRQRHLCQQKAATHQPSMKEKLRRLAQKAHFTK